MCHSKAVKKSMIFRNMDLDNSLKIVAPREPLFTKNYELNDEAFIKSRFSSMPPIKVKTKNYQSKQQPNQKSPIISPQSTSQRNEYSNLRPEFFLNDSDENFKTKAYYRSHNSAVNSDDSSNGNNNQYFISSNTKNSNHSHHQHHTHHHHNRNSSRSLKLLPKTSYDSDDNLN